MAEDPIENQTVATRAAAERVARIIGCTGAHQMGEGWMACESHEDLKMLIKLGNPAFREWKKQQGSKASPDVIAETKSLVSKKEQRYFSTYEAARKYAEENGYLTVRTMLRKGKQVFTVGNRRPNWQELNEMPISGIGNLEGGGLVSG